MKWLLIGVLIGCAYVADGQQKSNYINFAKAESSVNSIPANGYAQHQAFFCRKEWQLEQKIKIPVRIRVGSIEQCNYLEQKPGYTLQVK